MSYMLQFCYKIKEETENASFQLRHAWSKTIIDNVKKIFYTVYPILIIRKFVILRQNSKIK